MKRNFLRALGLCAFAMAPIFAQSPAPMVVQAAGPATPVAKVVPAVAPSEGGKAAELVAKGLLEMKATNAETIKQQEAALKALEDLEKAAAEIKIFGKRG